MAIMFVMNLRYPRHQVLFPSLAMQIINKLYGLFDSHDSKNETIRRSIKVRSSVMFDLQKTNQHTQICNRTCLVHHMRKRCQRNRLCHNSYRDIRKFM
jgi:hypothetical protein